MDQRKERDVYKRERYVHVERGKSVCLWFNENIEK